MVLRDWHSYPIPLRPSDNSEHPFDTQAVAQARGDSANFGGAHLRVTLARNPFVVMTAKYENETQRMLKPRRHSTTHTVI